MSKKALVTVAWPYVNGDLHLGHLAGNLLPPDMFARFLRLKGVDVLMVSGSDCYGTPITVEADKKGITPGEVVDLYHPKDIELFKLYNMSYNLYTKTTTQNHKEVVQQVFLDLLANGYIHKEAMDQYYAEADAQFLPDRYVVGECPHCNAQKQRGDQCESCGKWLGGGELINPQSAITGAKVTLKSTEHYFLDLGAFTPELRKYLDSKKDIWRNWVWSEADGWLREGLTKRAITRDLSWGVDLPADRIAELGEDKLIADISNKKIYVWFEAVVGYLSASVEWSSMERSNADVIFNRFEGQSLDWKEWWFDKDAKHYYFMGQDNLVFHTLMWPAQMIGTKKDYNLPHNVLVNRFMNYEGKKFSKSRGWTIDSRKMAEKFGSDAVRFYMAANFPENKEGNFTWEGFIELNNSVLVGTLGNFVNRSLKFLESKFDGALEVQNFELNVEVARAINEAFENAADCFDKGKITGALESVLDLARFGNKYFDDQQIWSVLKVDQAKAKHLLMEFVNIVNALGILIAPFMPDASEKLFKVLGRPELNPKVGVDSWKFEMLCAVKLNLAVDVLFEKLDGAEVMQVKEELR